MGKLDHDMSWISYVGKVNFDMESFRLKDPLSSYLFMLCSKKLSVLIHKIENQ